jgi:benzoyl-CoA reductase/2-hydroxyglutaryl-CoA dehydratase subunit BcrC/BadD/HgdB
MITLKTEIFHHDSDVDVTHKINTMELDNWINHLKYIKKELNNLISICNKELNNKLGDDKVVERFQKKEVENEALLNALLKYDKSRDNIIECEDTLCDMIYITEHESYRRSYLYHLDKYRRLKDEFFNKVQGKFTLVRFN